MGHRRCAAARLGVMMCQQFGLGLHRLGKLRLQHLRNTLVVLLPCALQERLIGGLLDQRMLEDIRRLGWQPLLVEELCLHQLVQPALDGRLIPRRDGPQQRIGKFAPQCGAELCKALHRCQAIQPGHQRVVQGGRDGQRRQRTGEFVAIVPLLEQTGL